jgi:clumping factor A
MIVVSLPLILVAVALLALGLTGGSSNLLISSIVASLLAAVALVVGARQTAGGRRVAEESVADPAVPEFTAEAPRRAPDDEFAAFASEEAGDARDTVQLDPVVAAYRSGRRDTAAGMPAGASGARRDDAEPADGPRGRWDDAEPADGPRGRWDDAGPDGASRARRDEAEAADAEPDYERAADAIHAARSDDEQAWRRAGRQEAAEPAEYAEAPGTSGYAEAAGPAGHAAASRSAAAGYAEPDLAEAEFAEPDEDDPADEPMPQSVRPADAVRVARMDAEVLVVDGRPRYHVADCRHLIGKLTEPVPVNEAVELGFSPCGLCRPVDRLVSAAAPH